MWYYNLTFYFNFIGWNRTAEKNTGSEGKRGDLPTPKTLASSKVRWYMFSSAVFGVGI